MNIVLRMLDRWLDQDVARANAAQACVRLLHDRRKWDEVETWLTRNPATPDPAHRRPHPRTPDPSGGTQEAADG